MHRPARALSSLALALTLAACQLPGGSNPVGKPSLKPTPIGARGGQLAGAVATLVGMDGATLIGLDAASLIGADGGSLIGADGASLIGADGGSLIGADGGSLIGADGGSLIGADGASLIGADGASIAGSVKAPAGLVAAGAGNAVSDMGGMYRIQAVSEKSLANVHVYLRTASGKFVVDRKTGKLITAVTNAKGEYSFKGWRAVRGLTVFVPSARVAGEIQGLAGLRPKDQGEAAPVAIDMASTLMTAWIFDRVLASQADRGKSLDRLPAALGAETYGRVAAAARADLVPAASKLASKGFADALERLRAEDAAISAKLEEVRKVMTLAGTDSTVAASARAITLQQPVDVAQAPDGALFVAEAFSGVVRRIGTDGQATPVVGQGSRNEGQIGSIFATDIAIGPDGKLYMNAKYAAEIFRCNPDGSGFETFAGGGQTLVGPGVKALGAKFEPARAIAFDAAGGLLIAEGDADAQKAESRLLRIAPDGTIADLGAPWAGQPALPGAWREINALTVAPDGALWVMEFQEGALWLREPGQPWRAVARQLATSHYADLLPRPDGSVLISMGQRFDDGEQVIDRVTRTGERARFAGTGEMGANASDVAALAAKFADPAGLIAGRDGAVLVADSLGGMVSAIGADGTVRIVAGRTTGDDVAALAEPLNVPGGIAIDARGRVIVSEYAGHSIRRIDGDRSVRIAGGEPGVAAEGGRADKLYAPAGVAFLGEDMIVVEQGPQLVRRIRADGTIETLAGGGVAQPVSAEANASPPRARDIRLREPLAVAVSPAGLVHFTDREHVWRINGDGSLTLIAGWSVLTAGEASAPRDGKPAREVPIGRLAGILFDKAGNLYLTEVNTSQILKIDPAGILSVFAGAGSDATFVALLGGTIGTEGEVAAKDAVLVVPSGLAFDAAGNLYVTEMGTRGVQSLASSFFGGSSAIPLVDGRIRKITPAGRVTTIAGLGGPSGTELRNPIGVVVDLEGHVIFVDNGTNQLKRL